MDNDDFKSARRKFLIITIPFCTLLILRESLFIRTTLLTETPAALVSISYVMGMALWGYLIFQVLRGDGFQCGRLKRTWLALFCLVLLCFLCSYLFRWAFEIAAFTRMETHKYEQEVRITSVLHKNKAIGYRVSVQAFPDGRVIDNIFVTRDVHASLSDKRPHLWQLSSSDPGYCFTLQAERGRWGVVRADIPALWDDGLNSYHRCNGMPKRLPKSAGSMAVAIASYSSFGRAVIA